MNPNGKILITTAAICLIALIVVSAGWSVATSFGLVRVGSVNFMVGGRPGGAFAGRELENGQGAFQPPEGFQPGDGNFQPPEGFQQGRQNFSSDFSPRTGLVGLLGIARWLGVGLSIAAIIAGIFAVIGLFRQKKWGVNLAIILAALLALTGVSSFFRFAIDLNTCIAALKVLLAVAVIILLLLPASRQALKPATVAVSEIEAEEEDLTFRTIR